MEQEKSNAEEAKVQTRAKLTPVFDMVSDACKVYAKNFKKFIGVYLWGLIGFIPLVVVMIVFGVLTGMNLFTGSILFRIIFVIVIIVAVLWAIYYGIRIKAAMLLLIKNNYTSAKENFKQSKDYFWGFLWMSIILTVVVCLWTILLIIPGIIFATYFMLVNYTFFFEDFKGYSALKRSKELVRGYWWAAFGRSLFLGLLVAILSIILSVPLTAFEQGSAGYSIYNGIMNVIWAVLSPIFVIYAYYIFRDLKNIKGESKLIATKK